MRRVVFLIITSFFLFTFISSVNAQSGCCSHHGGVNGCNCGDGTPLSSTCIKYYPQCQSGGSQTNTQQNTSSPTNTPYIPNPTVSSNSNQAPVFYPTDTPYPTNTPFPTNTLIPTKVPTPKPTVTSKPTSTPKPTSPIIKSKKSTSPSFWQWLLGLFSWGQKKQSNPVTLTPNPTITVIPTATYIPITNQRTKTSGCVIVGAFPDKNCTPGAVFPNVTKDEICTPGYSKTVRNVPESEKEQVYQEYGITSHYSGQYEVDHDIPLELGGSNDVSNLWTEPANPTPGFHEKDKVENYLHEEVCNGTITLQQAQQEIVSNWLQVYQQINH